MKAKTVLLTFATVLLICACGSPPAGECIVIRGNSANSLAAAPVEVVSSAVIYEDSGDLSDHYPVVVTVR